ncbi:hypothetical protein HY68_12630 [Streptomyces sp. AcH 505]|uniref:hypothetical protein n=1 Tax=Streptomyces sp. AcH 505 TaxID=352211 RepID=UPI000591BF57|nr:hypothetical protein HY68_12630 [Streptomyces sp. AcH 505]
MKIRMLVEMSGTRDGQPWPAKGVPTELPTAAAAHLVAAGVAEEVPDGGAPAARKRREPRGDRHADGGDS